MIKKRVKLKTVPNNGQYELIVFKELNRTLSYVGAGTWHIRNDKELIKVFQRCCTLDQAIVKFRSTL